jgi:Transglycosylase SLT domain
MLPDARYESGGSRTGEIFMLVDSSNSAAGSAVTGAISQASQATGTSFHYILATTKVESGLNPHAGASTSSARGLFQFIETTWLATLKQAGPALGYVPTRSARVPAAITRCAIHPCAANSSSSAATRSPTR